MSAVREEAIRDRVMEVFVETWRRATLEIVERWEMSAWLRERCRTEGEARYWLAVYDELMG